MNKIFVLYKKDGILLDSLSDFINDFQNIKLFYQDNNFLKFDIYGDIFLSIENKEYLFNQKIDWGIVPKIRFNDINLIISDMDSTFITIECVDEIANYIGIKDKVASITKMAMEGKLNFSESLKKRCSLLKGVSIDALNYVYDNQIKLSNGMNEFLKLSQELNIKFALISGGFTFFTDKLKQKYNLDYTFANRLEIVNNKLTGNVFSPIVDANFKVDTLILLAKKLSIDYNQILALGDGANDIPMLEKAGIGVAYKAKLKTKENANLILDFGNMDIIPDFFLTD